MALVASNLADRVAESLTRYNMLTPAAKVGIGVSGGADSVVLLHLLHRLNYEVVVLHVNHCLRGAESDGDEHFVRELAGQLGVAIEVMRVAVGEGNEEQAAREARRQFFFEAKNRLNLERVALAHNRSDQAETVLYRFLRGSGLAGLAGMRPLTDDGLIRPLLKVGRQEIRSWAASEGIVWREDSSNQNPAFVRNRLRRNIIPKLVEDFNPRLEEVLAGNAAVAQAEEEWWNLRIEAVYGQITKRTYLGSFFQIDEISALHPAEQRRFLRRAIQEVKGDLRSIDLQHIEGIRKIIRTEAGHDRVLIPGVDALRSFGTLLLSPPGNIGNIGRHYLIPVTVGEQVALPFELGNLYVNAVKTEGLNCANFGREALLDGDLVSDKNPPKGLQVRNWEPGDEMVRSHNGKPEKLKTLFQEFRILLWERRNWPVLVKGDEIVWAREFGSAANFRAKDSSRHVLRVIDRGGSRNCESKAEERRLT